MNSTPPSAANPHEDNAPQNRFTSQASTAEDLLKFQTVGLVHLSDFRKRRAEAIEQKELQAGSFGRFAPAASSKPGSGTATPNSNDEGATTPLERPKKKRKPAAKGKLSFGIDDAEDDVDESSTLATLKSSKASTPDPRDHSSEPPSKSRIVPNASVAHMPKVLTKATLRAESLTREALRRDFLAMQEAVRAAPIEIPFVFYDGSSTPGGICTMTKGEQIWLVLDRARKVGAKMGVSNSSNSNGTHDNRSQDGSTAGVSAGGGKANRSRSHWARIGVDDLLLVRGGIIIPHHYEIYYFIINKTKGPNSKALFDYSSTATLKPSGRAGHSKQGEKKNSRVNAEEEEEEEEAYDPFSAHRKNDHLENEYQQKDIEGSNDDPSFTKVVDRRWYERNKHIYPASLWEEFDPGKEYEGRVKKDAQGNAFFFS